MPKKRDLATYDPKSAKNPLNQGKMQKPVTEEIGYLEYGGESRNNPKNRPQPRARAGYQAKSEPRVK